jgi:hypothetical protein
MSRTLARVPLLEPTSWHGSTRDDKLTLISEGSEQMTYGALSELDQELI